MTTEEYEDIVAKVRKELGVAVSVERKTADYIHNPLHAHLITMVVAVAGIVVLGFLFWSFINRPQNLGKPELLAPIAEVKKGTVVEERATPQAKAPTHYRATTPAAQAKLDQMTGGKSKTDDVIAVTETKAPAPFGETVAATQARGSDHVELTRVPANPFAHWENDWRFDLMRQRDRYDGATKASPPPSDYWQAGVDFQIASFRTPLWGMRLYPVVGVSRTWSLRGASDTAPMGDRTTFGAGLTLHRP